MNELLKGETRETLYSSLDYMVKRCKTKEHHNDLYGCMMENFNAVNDNAQTIKRAVCKNSEGGENITDYELELIEESFSKMVANIFESYDCLMDNLPHIARNTMIEKLTDKLSAFLEDRQL